MKVKQWEIIMKFLVGTLIFVCICICGCSSYGYKPHAAKDNTAIIDNITVIDSPIDFYIDKTTENDIIGALGVSIERIEYFDDDEYWCLGYPNCYESGMDTVKHVKMTYDGIYVISNEINKNHIQVATHKIVIRFHHINGQDVTQSYDNKFSLIIHNDKLRGVPEGPDGRAGGCVYLVDHRKP